MFLFFIIGSFIIGCVFFSWSDSGILLFLLVFKDSTFGFVDSVGQLLCISLISAVFVVSFLVFCLGFNVFFMFAIVVLNYWGGYLHLQFPNFLLGCSQDTTVNSTQHRGVFWIFKGNMAVLKTCWILHKLLAWDNSVLTLDNTVFLIPQCLQTGFCCYSFSSYSHRGVGSNYLIHHYWKWKFWVVVLNSLFFKLRTKTYFLLY